jgi:hypothetical protein
MSQIIFGSTVSMINAATPSTGWLIGYDLDGVLKQKDKFGVIEEISIDQKAIVVNSNITAQNDRVYHVVSNATFTDPTPVEGRGFTVFVRNGTATVGSLSFTSGMLIIRTFHSGIWSNSSYSRSAVSNSTDESTSNKSIDVNTDQASNSKYPSVKAVFDWTTNSFFPKPTGTSSQYIKGDGTLGTFSNIEEFTYESLKEIVDEEMLKPGNYYLLTDFETIYNRPDYYDNDDNILPKEEITPVSSGIIEPLILLAISGSTFSNQVYSKIHTLDYLEYEFDYIPNSKGRITRRRDHNNNETNYDHRVIQFKRYDRDGDGIYIHFYDTGDNDFELKYTFGDNCKNNVFERQNPETLISNIGFDLENNVFGNNCIDNTFGLLSILNTIGDDFKWNRIGREFVGNNILIKFQSNKIGNRFKYNKFIE